MSGLLVAAAALGDARAEPSPIPVAVLEFDYLDTSGETREQRAFHAERLRQFASSLRADLERSGHFRVVQMTCADAPCSITESDPAELVGAARKAGARLLLFGGVHKMSTLVQWAKAQMVDVQTEQLVFDRLLTFRGDDTGAWQHAEAFLVKDISTQPLIK